MTHLSHFTAFIIYRFTDDRFIGRIGLPALSFTSGFTDHRLISLPVSSVTGQWFTGLPAYSIYRLIIYFTGLPDDRFTGRIDASIYRRIDITHRIYRFYRRIIYRLNRFYRRPASSTIGRFASAHHLPV
jgi:hypothetical protein